MKLTAEFAIEVNSFFEEVLMKFGIGFCFLLIFSVSLLRGESIVEVVPNSDQCLLTAVDDETPPCDDSCYWDYNGWEDPCVKGIWLPESPPLFRPFLADPRQVTSSVGWRWGDIFDDNEGVVSFGDIVPVYRWYQPFGYPGTIEFDVEGALWAVFEPVQDDGPLVNADYYAGLPIAYQLGSWSFRLRLYHISCHIGDEFLLNHPGFDRRNASSEYIDFFASWQYNKQLRLYGGLGWILRSDKSFPCRKFFAEYGAEYYFSFWDFYYAPSHILGRPFYGMHFRTRADNDYKFDGTFVLGYEFAKMCGTERRLRFFGEYHSGFSVEGQFCRQRASYGALRVSYGY